MTTPVSNLNPDEYLPVPVESAKEIARKFRKEMVIINAWDDMHQTLHTTTYGEGPIHKAMAADGGTIAARALDADMLQAHAFEDYRLTWALRLLAVLKAMATFHGAAHDGDCPEDDTCRCRFKPFNDLVNQTINDAGEVLGEVEEATW